MPTLIELQRYWSAPLVQNNIIVIFHLLGALALGLIVGYERSFHGRAAGMRTYGLVSMTSAALTVIIGYAPAWFGGESGATPAADASRVIQGIVTGIGFLCAGVIMRENYSITGLTTAASLWCASVIGVLVGVGFYLAAIALVALTTLAMVWILWLESRLPTHPTIVVQLTYEAGVAPDPQALRQVTRDHGYELRASSLDISCSDGAQRWTFSASARDRRHALPIAELARSLGQVPGLRSYDLHHART